MPASLKHIHSFTPMGANLIADGATFRVWAPNARSVHVLGDFNGNALDHTSLLTRDPNGHWLGFFPGAKDRQKYMFYVVGEGSQGFKRDPYARELETPHPSKCILRAADFPWHDTPHTTPALADLVIYQLHVGTFFTPNLPNKAGTFLDVARKVPYLAELGVTAVQLLPIQEFQTQYGQGYNGTDYFSPEMNYAAPDAAIPAFLPDINALLHVKGLAPYQAQDLKGEMNQLKALVDVCHAYGLAVLLDVVYNHAGGDFGDESMYFLDRQHDGDGRRNSLYFSDRGHAGGLVFDYAKPDVRDFLIHNAKFFLDEYRVDGFRYDQVSVIDHDGAPHGWRFCQDLTSTLHYHRPGSVHLAEYWNVNPHVVQPVPHGAGFDTTLTDGLRRAIRDVIESASAPDERPLNMTALGASMWPNGFTHAGQFVQGPENHDLVLEGREARVARLSDPSNPRSWYARSRARVATALSLTAPGIPMLFMGQEFLEDKPWSDDVVRRANLLLHWAGLSGGDRDMLDHVRFVRELLALRQCLPGLRGDGFRVVHAHDENRVLAVHRWVHGAGHDVVIVAHLGNSHRFDYRVGMPHAGVWHEVFNSDVYEQWVNPLVCGNGGQVHANDVPMHGFHASAPLTLPANSLLVFTT
ncbi:alpha-amylase family glycosyl hydrolase [Deinococcus yavapaiensis]|uniref:1,4-alpha-glucan branching enzyme n=1 Tax=Deinococcus yavapaiensis KR-236 TaxID=694435 RepID=A0A318S4Q6_9DEIO|nr:alpha amylase C-terminal domain-containing protein [Deinococcus yavapaiensis]PYE52058.1 1,4-alpha-glucan branching enzyme [Deinococcus yavapaiensis KR-236]